MASFPENKEHFIATSVYRRTVFVVSAILLRGKVDYLSRVPTSYFVLICYYDFRQNAQ